MTNGKGATYLVCCCKMGNSLDLSPVLVVVIECWEMKILQTQEYHENGSVVFAYCVLKNEYLKLICDSSFNLYDLMIHFVWVVDFHRHEAELAAAASQPLPDDDDDTFE